MSERSNIYFSEAENIVFYIPDFYPDQSYNVVDIIKMLQEGSAVLEKALAKEGVAVDTNQIKTEYITKSSRYKSMRVWWYKCSTCPKDAFRITAANDWTMWKWINN